MSGGSPAGPVSSCPCACSHGCSGDRFLKELAAAHRRGELRFFGEYAALADPAVFARWLVPLRACEWVVYAKRPLAGPEAVLAYLSRYTHRVAISNQRLVSLDERGVTFRWKDCRAKGRTRYKTMTLGAYEFMRRFLLHMLPRGFHRIRHYGLLPNPVRRQNLAKVRGLLHVVPAASTQPDDTGPAVRPAFICRHCGAPMIVIEVLQRSPPIRAPPAQRAAA
ncbi:Putative transposase [Caballeronia choica]|uniref:Transposase n=1 Tax=Caballeronia choica TaxID=326476 RepID=A0A158F8D9_9BURK|nr:Putative transposase [Caballeronia choica]